MKIKNTRVMNFDGAIRGMRNPLESWDKSDSHYFSTTGEKYNYDLDFALGTADLALAQRLIRAGSADRKFMRQIFVCVDVTAPLYWWSEYETYKVATVSNSTSKMHKLASTPVMSDRFETDDFDATAYDESDIYSLNSFIGTLEKLRQKYNETKDIKYWKELIRWLPESWSQTRTLTFDYETLRGMYFARRNHKLTEWHTFCHWIEKLPYAMELITIEQNGDKNE